MQTCIRKALHWIALGDPHIKIPALCEAVSIQDGIDKIDEDDFIDEAEISRRCGCLLRKSLDGDYFEFAHFTVLEYLRSTSSESSVEKFRYSEHDAFLSLAETAVRFLLFPCFDRKPTLSRATERTYCMERDQRHPFYLQAAAILLCLTSFHSRDLLRSQLFEEEPVFSWMKRLFNVDMSGSFMTWAQAISSHDKSLIDEIRSPSASPLHFAAFLAMPELCRFLLQQGADVNSSNFGTPLREVIASTLAMKRANASQQLRFSSSPGAGRWAQTLSVLLDHGADTSLLFDGQSDLSVAFDSLSGPEILPFIRPSTAVPEDAIKAFSNRKYDHDADDQLIQAILELSTGVDAPPQWKAMAAPALTLSRRRGLTVPDHTVHLLLEHYSDADYPKALEVATQVGLVADLSALIADPRFAADGCRLLHVAAKSKSSNSGQIARILLDSGLDLNTVDSKSQTCLHTSCESGNVEVAQVLLVRGADVSCRDTKGQTAWHIAASNGHKGVLKVLLQQDRDVLQGLATSSVDGRTPLFSAIGAGHVEASLLLLERCPAESRFFKSRDPLLHDAVGTGSQELFSALIDKGVDLHAVELGSNPLHHLGASCTAGFVEYLGTIYDPLSLDACHKPPFERFLQRWICHNGEAYEDKTVPLNAELLELLLPASLEFSLNSTPPRTVHAWEIICEVIGPEDLCCFGTDKSDSDSDPTDSVTCEDFFSRSLQTIINHGVLLSYKDTRKKPSVVPLITALLKRQEGHFCSASIASLIAAVMKCSTLQPSLDDIEGSHELLKKAISEDASTLVSTLIQYGADVHRREPKNDWGELSESPLEAACFKAEIATFQAVLATALPSRLNDMGPTGDTPIDLVVKGSSPDKTSMIKALHDKGADPKSCNREKSAILHAVKEGEWSVVKCLARLGADIFAKDKEDDWGLAHYAVDQGKLDILKWLVESTSDPSQWQTTCTAHTHSHKDAAGKQSFVDDGVSLLHMAANNQQQMEYLLQQGIFTDVNALTNCRRTPLHYAAFSGPYSCCRILLDYGAELTARDENGKLSIEYALDGGYTETVTLLLKAGSPLPQALAHGVGDIIWNLSANKGLEIARNHYFEKAIRAGDLEQCKTAVSQGCSLDNPLPSCHICTPLFTAISARRGNIVEWLIKQGASPLGVFCHHHVYPEVIQHAAFNLRSRKYMGYVLSAALRHGICWYPVLTSSIYLAVNLDKVEIIHAIISHVKRNTARYQ